MFLAWFDDSPKHSTPQKIADACAAYRERYGVKPSVVLMAAGAEVTVEDVQVLGVAWVRPNYVYVGMEG